MNKLPAPLVVTYPHVEVGLPALSPHGPDGGDHEPGQLHAAVGVVRAGHCQHTVMEYRHTTYSRCFDEYTVFGES